MAYLLAGQHIQILENNTDCNVGLGYNYNYDIFTSKSDRNKLDSFTSRSDSTFAEKFPFFFFLIPFLRFVSGSTETLANLTLKKIQLIRKPLLQHLKRERGFIFYALYDSTIWLIVLSSNRYQFQLHLGLWHIKQALISDTAKNLTSTPKL